MSKPYYETEEYSEAENELDTYDDPVKLVMEYRVSEKHKDQQIAELKQQLAEKDELLKQKIGDMKSTDFIKMCIKSGFMVEAKENDNQTAIAELEKVEDYIVTDEKDMFGMPYLMKAEYILEFIDNQIKSLKGEK